MSTAQELKAQGNKAFVEKNYQEAIKFYSQAIEQDSTDVSFYSNRSGAYFNQGDYESALKDAEQCIQVDPNFVKGYSRKGLTLEKMGEHEKALQVYEEGLKIDGGNKDLLSGKERCQSGQNPQFDINSLLQNPMIQDLIQKNPQLAQQLFSNPDMLKNPQMMQAMMNLFSQQQQQSSPQDGQQETQQNQFNPQQQESQQFTQPKQNEQSQDQFNQFQQQQQNQQQPSNTHQSKPQAQKQQDTQKQTKKPLNEFDKLKAEGDKLYMAKKFDEAIEQYQKCVDLDPNHLIPRSNQAVCYVEKKDYQKAHEILDEAIKIYKECDFDKRSFEDYAKILEKKGRVYVLQNDIDNALDYYNQSLLENNVGRVSATLRELKRKKKKLEEEAYIDPELSEKHRNQGNEYYKAQKYPEAIREYEEAQKRNPQDPKVYNNLCAAFMKMLRFDEAKKFADKVLEMEPDNTKAMNKKAQIHSCLKEFHKAIEMYQKVLVIDANNVEAQNGFRDTQMKIQMQMGQGNDEERLQRAMQDPEIQAIMIDPMVRIALEQMQKDPKTAMEYMQDQTLGPKIQKLIQAGVLKVA